MMQFLHSVLRQNPGIVCALGQNNTMQHSFNRRWPNATQQ